MSDNIITVYGEVPDLVEKKSSEMINKYLQTEKDDFNFIKFNLYETEMKKL